jgi:hypothetical protein
VRLKPRLSLGIASVLWISACTSTPVATSSAAAQTAEPGAAAISTATLEPIPSATDEPVPTDVPEPTLATYGLGQPITVNGDDDNPAVVITFTKFSQHTSYGSGYLVSRPASGNIYVQVWVTYKAIQNGVSYNPFDWQVFVGDVAQQNFSIILESPTPALSSGTLPAGRTAQGWLVYEVPTSGRMVLSYSRMFSSGPPLFEVVVRS